MYLQSTYLDYSLTLKMVSIKNDNNNDNNINNSFEGIKFTIETPYFKNPV